MQTGQKNAIGEFLQMGGIRGIGGWHLLFVLLEWTLSLSKAIRGAGCLHSDSRPYSLVLNVPFTSFSLYTSPLFEAFLTMSGRFVRSSKYREWQYSPDCNPLR